MLKAESKERARAKAKIRGKLESLVKDMRATLYLAMSLEDEGVISFDELQQMQEGLVCESANLMSPKPDTLTLKISKRSGKYILQKSML